MASLGVRLWAFKNMVTLLRLLFSNTDTVEGSVVTVNFDQDIRIEYSVRREKAQQRA